MKEKAQNLQNDNSLRNVEIITVSTWPALFQS